MLKRMTLEYAGTEAICLGDDISFQYPWKGWGAKIELFSPGFVYRPCLYLDLDTYLLGDIRRFLEEPDKLMLIRDFNKPRRGNSGVMQIPRNVDKIWDIVKTYDGRSPDGNLLNTCPHGYLQDKYPNQIVSYKADKCTDKPEVPIMCFHGKPKPHTSEGWAREEWLHWTQ